MCVVHALGTGHLLLNAGVHGDAAILEGAGINADLIQRMQKEYAALESAPWANIFNDE